MRVDPVCILALLGALLGVLSAATSRALRYQAPYECKWMTVAQDGSETEVSSSSDPDQEVALICRLKTINSEIENTNFSIIQPQHTVRLRIECGDLLFIESSISPGSFQTLIDLKDLSIEYCKIANLSAGAFRGLRELRNLTIRTHNTDWSAMTLNLAPDLFSQLSQLHRLDLSANNMWTLPEGIFCPLKNLQHLNLTRNRITNLEGLKFGGNPSSSSQKCGPLLQSLDISNNSLDTLSSYAFSHLSRLQRISLQGNVISFMADHALDGLSSLTFLNLADNKLVNLPPEIFTDIRGIKEVYLQNNSINVLAPGIFNGLDQLLVLDLSSNELTDEWVNSATFTGMIRLILLNLSSNNIAKVDPSMFKDLYSLQIINLEDNAIEVIVENTFKHLHNLHTLILSKNKIRRVESNTFDGLIALNVLSIDNNVIEYIDPEALKNSSSLRDFHLNGNKLYDIPAVLNQVPNLKTLDLGDNLITDIYNDSFVMMEQLVGLRLTENNISNVTKGVFDKMVSLRILNLSSNKIRKVEAGTLDFNSNLLAIRLDGNYLTDIGGLFSKLPNLVWLNISENLLEWFDYALIPTGLQWLDIHSNRITELGNYFEIESQLHLTVFDASFNRLTEITGNSIPDSVENLYLAHNQIAKVQSYTFFKKPNLTKVDLSNNQIESLTHNSLRISTIPKDKNIPEFLIGNNPFQCDCNMQWLQTYSLDQERNKPNLVDLNTVNCKLLYNRVKSYVLLHQATQDQFLCQYDSFCYPFCHCCDFDACDCEMTCPTNCTCYHDVSWSANVVDCSRAGYADNLPLRIPMEATQLYLDGNHIRTIGSHSFIGRRKLQILFLNSSNIEIIHNRTFNGLKELEVLHLDDNKLNALKGYEFEGLRSLRELYLNNNRITSIHNYTFSSLYDLKILRLDHNQIKTFAVWTSVTSKLNALALGSNSWSCECDFVKKLHDFVAFNKASIIDISDIRCVNRSGMYDNGFLVTEENMSSCVNNQNSLSVSSKSSDNAILDENNMSNNIESALNSNNLQANKTVIQKQMIQDYLPLLVITISVFFVIVISTLIVLLYKQELRVWFHSRFGVRLFYKSSEIEMDDRDKLFDAFVSYSSKDETFVAEELAPILENGDPAYKLCLHHREFPAGGYIADTIVQAVESSRRTIMVLSENFIKSEWCRFEFKSAHHQVLRDKRKRLIVILLGELPQKDLDPEIRLYLKTNSYLQWGDKLFWEKLKFALPDVPNNRRRNHYTNRQHHTHNHNMHHIHRHHNRNHNHHTHHNNHNNTVRSVAIHI